MLRDRGTSGFGVNFGGYHTPLSSDKSAHASRAKRFRLVETCSSADSVEGVERNPRKNRIKIEADTRSQRLKHEPGLAAAEAEVINSSEHSSRRRKKVEELEREIVALQLALNDNQDALIEERTENAELQQQVDCLSSDLAFLSGDPVAVAECSLDDCNTVIAELTHTLQVVHARKMQLLETDLQTTKQIRLCSICWEHDKNVVLLPCRHYCLCQNCSGPRTLVNCLICRQKITEKVCIFG